MQIDNRTEKRDTRGELPKDEDEPAPATIAFLDRILTAYAEGAEQEEIRATEWVAYLTGSLSPERTRLLAQRIVSQPALRQQLRATFHALQEVRKRPLTPTATGESEVALVWRAALAQYVGDFTHVLADGLRRGWEWIQNGISAGDAKAAVLQEALQADIRRIRASAAGTGGTGLGPALVRGGSASRFLPVVGANGGTDRTRVRVRRAVVARDGSVSLTVSWEGEAPEGELVYLGLRGAAGGWLLATAVCQGATTSWKIPQLGPALFLEAGPLPLEGFYLCVGSFPELPDDGVVLLLAAILRADGIRVDEALLEAQALMVAAGELHLTLVLPEDVRRRYPTAVLALDLHPGTGRTQRLGEWPLAEWKEDARAVVMPLPVTETSLRVLAASLTATLQEH